MSFRIHKVDLKCDDEVCETRQGVLVTSRKETYASDKHASENANL